MAPAGGLLRVRWIRQVLEPFWRLLHFRRRHRRLTNSTGGIDPLTGAATTPVEGAASGSDTNLLERVAVGRHEGYDRVVFQFKNALPGYKVEYVQPPLKEDGSGKSGLSSKAMRSWSFGWSPLRAST